MKDICVLSSACGAMFMPGFFKCLKENNERNIKIVGIDMADNPMMGDLLDAYYQVPAFTAPNYVDILLDICKKENVDVFFPHISMELPLILDNVDRFKELGVKVAITDSKTLLTANNKLALYDFMEDNDLDVPQYYAIKNSEDLRKYAERLGFPDKAVCVKVAESSGSRGVRIVRNNISRADAFLHQKPSSLNVTMDEMCSILDDCKELPDTIVMEYLPGCEYTVDLLADHGKVLYIAGRRNYESSMSIAMATVIEQKDKAYKTAEDVVKALKLDGNIGFDFMLDENDEPVLTDVNPRITATIILYKEGGLNLPYLRVKQLLGEELPKCELKYGVRMKRRYWDVFE